MADMPTWSDLMKIAADEALFRSGNLSREMVQRDGSDANIMLAGACAAADEVVGQLADLAASLFLDSARGMALDRLLFDRYGLARKPAANAVGSVRFTTTAAATAPFTIPSGTLLSAADGTQYVTVADALYPLGSTGPILATVRSVLAGSAQQAKIGTITSITGTITGAPADLVVTNTVATAGASDAESDSEYSARGRSFFTTARRGVLASIEQGALAVPGVVRAKAIEVVDAYGRPARIVLLMISDSYTDALAQLGTVPATYQAQSQTLALTVYNGLAEYRAGGIFVHVQVAQVIMLPVHLRLSFRAGANIESVAVQARAVATAYVNGLQPGVAFVRKTLQDQLAAVTGLFITGDEIESPSGDVVPTPLQALRTTMAISSAAATDSSRPLAAFTNPDAFVEV